MKLVKATHKAMLYKLFYENGRAKAFPVEKLIIAASAAGKLLKHTEGEGNNKRAVDGEVDFSAEEWVLLKELWKDKKSGTIEEAPVIEELKEIFK